MVEAALTPALAGLLDKGLEFHKSGDVKAAIKSYEAVLKKRPSQPDALWLKGVAKLSMGEPEAAVKLIELAFRGRPEDPEILNDLGMAQEAAGAEQAAQTSFDKALELNPDLPSVLVNVARCALASGNTENALKTSSRAVELQPEMSDAHNIRGLALKQLGQFEDARAAFSVALSIEPHNVPILINMGEFLRERGQLDRAQTTLEQALAATQKGTVDWVNATLTLGLVFAKTGRYDDARERYNSILALVPDHLESLVNRGELNQSTGYVEAAEADYNAALKIAPESSTAQYNLGRLHLLKQNWEKGWIAHESRWRTPEFAAQDRSRNIPVWNGALRPDLNLLVWGEQGLGDQVLFASQIAELIAKGVLPTLEVDPRLAPTLQRSFSCLSVCGYDDIDAGTVISFENQIPIGSLGRILRKTASDFPPGSSYLVADTDLTRELRDRYLSRAKGRKIVGIAWNSINPTFGVQKSLPLEHWEAILRHHRDALFISLQYGDIRNEVMQASRVSGADIFIDDEVDPVGDFDAAVAQIAAMDLIISTSSTAVHLAGALGVKTWVMVRCVPEWRWGLEGKRVPWYDSVRVYRQPEQGNWTPVLTDVAGDLERWLSD